MKVAGPLNMEERFTTEENNSIKAKLKRTVKDSVFTDLFAQKKYLIQLYRSLHPED